MHGTVHFQSLPLFYLWLHRELRNKVIDNICLLFFTHPGSCVYPFIAALRGGVQENGDVRKWQVLQRASSPVKILLIP